MKQFKYATLAILAISMSGCAAATVALEHKDLDVQTKMSNTIFLPPVSPSAKTMWTGFHNTSDKDVDLAGQVRACLMEDGYRLVNDPAHAHYWLQVNVRAFGKASPSAAQETLLAGFGGTVTGALAGAAVGGATNGGTGAGYGAAIGGLLGAAASTIANALVKDVTYVGVTDVQVSERSAEPLQQQKHSSIHEGSSTVVSQSVSGPTNRLQYRTRIVSTANKVNLEFAEAQPRITHALSHSICGVF